MKASAKRGKDNHFFGKGNLLALEAARKANIGRPLTEEHKLKLSVANKGKNPYWANTPEMHKKSWETRKRNGNDRLSEEHKRCISNSTKGIKKSPEHIANAKAAQKIAFEKRKKQKESEDKI